jgi:hypothetical protein
MHISVTHPGSVLLGYLGLTRVDQVDSVMIITRVYLLWTATWPFHLFCSFLSLMFVLQMIKGMKMIKKWKIKIVARFSLGFSLL